MAERTCIVTRTVCDPAQMIRFVLGPDNVPVPDLKRTLPGRGVWVTARREIVEQAVAKGAFAKGFKAAAKADAELPDLVDRLLAEAALGALGFARKAGECVTGSTKVGAALGNGKVIGLLHALDGADDGIKKLSAAAFAARTKKGRVAPIWRVFTSSQMDLALGATNVIHAALVQGGAARNCAKRITALADYRQTGPDKVSEQIETATNAADENLATGNQGREGRDVNE